MNDMERRKFEDSFQEAFKDAEANPSENVWTNIELDLEKADGDKMKRRLVFFKMLAAASIVFAMSVAGIGYYVFQRSDMGNLAQQTAPIADQDKSKDEASASSLKNDSQVSSLEEADANVSGDETRTNKSLAPVADGSQQGKDELLRQDAGLSPTAKANDETKNGSNKRSNNGTIAKGATTLIAADQNPNSTVAQKRSKANGNDKTANTTTPTSATSTQDDLIISTSAAVARRNNAETS